MHTPTYIHTWKRILNIYIHTWKSILNIYIHTCKSIHNSHMSWWHCSCCICCCPPCTHLHTLTHAKPSITHICLDGIVLVILLLSAIYTPTYTHTYKSIHNSHMSWWHCSCYICCCPPTPWGYMRHTNHTANCCLECMILCYWCMCIEICE